LGLNDRACGQNDRCAKSAQRKNCTLFHNA
jgi:hypothetical protein